MNRTTSSTNRPAVLAIVCRACAEARRPARREPCLRAPCVIATAKLKAPIRS